MAEKKQLQKKAQKQSAALNKQQEIVHAELHEQIPLFERTSRRSVTPMPQDDEMENFQDERSYPLSPRIIIETPSSTPPLRNDLRPNPMNKIKRKEKKSNFDERKSCSTLPRSTVQSTSLPLSKLSENSLDKNFIRAKKKFAVTETTPSISTDESFNESSFSSQKNISSDLCETQVTL